MKGIVKEYPDAQLLLAGNGPEKENLENLIRDLGLQKNVKMLGYVTNLQEYQKMADVSVSCSKREGLPLNIVEAMLSGTPVVASENRGHRELIRDGKNGYLVAVNDEKQLTEKILRLLKNGEQYQKVSVNAQYSAKFYGYDNVKKELKKVYGLE